MAVAEIDAALAAARLPILVGGTGLYLRALLRGMAPVPDIPPEVRESVRWRQASLTAPALHAELAAKDARMAARLRPADSQRIARALEVMEATGRSLADYQSQADTGAGAYDALVIAALPPRRPLYEKIDRRLAEMVATGALDEVRHLMDMHLDPSLPAMKAVGVPDLMAHLRGETSLDQALAAAQQATRRYAKRQMTWLRHQTPKDADKAIFHHAQLSERLTPIIFNEIRQFMLTAQP
jgi:tRNA dimethylallyltransferase